MIGRVDFLDYLEAAAWDGFHRYTRGQPVEDCFGKICGYATFVSDTHWLKHDYETTFGTCGDRLYWAYLHWSRQPDKYKTEQFIRESRTVVFDSVIQTPTVAYPLTKLSEFWDEIVCPLRSIEGIVRLIGLMKSWVFMAEMTDIIDHCGASDIYDFLRVQDPQKIYLRAHQAEVPRGTADSLFREILYSQNEYSDD